MEDAQQNELEKISFMTTGPVLFDFVWWILHEAQNRKLKVLYFLARDGYILREIALKFCQKFHLDIECRYLYCSRASLRMPSYHLIGEEAYDLLLLGGYRITPQSLLARAELTESQQALILRDLEIPAGEEYAVLSKLSFHSFAKKLRQNGHYRDHVQEKSRLSYDNAICYLTQEISVSTEHIGIVDSGWTGSMQRSLRKLLNSAGFVGKITGFYFGMFAPPKETDDGEYLTWYFNHSSGKADKVRFCNNLFECMLSAPHGMTVGYQQSQSGYEPVLLSSPSNLQMAMIKDQIQGILRYADLTLNKLSFSSFDAILAKARARRLLRRLMVRPTKDEVNLYGRFLFSDDITELFSKPLASREQLNALKGYSLIPRIYQKLLRKTDAVPVQELFWPYGTISLAPAVMRPWYRLNVYIWEWLRYTLR